MTRSVSVVMSSAGFIVRVTIVVPDLVGAFIAMGSALSGPSLATPKSEHLTDAGGRDGSPASGGPFVGAELSAVLMPTMDWSHCTRRQPTSQPRT
jgi:hypothetical protein